MNKRELLETYRDMVLEINGIEKEMEFIMRIGPAPVGSINLTGMPHGTNDSQAAQGQRYDKYVEQLRTIQDNLYELLDEAEQIMEELTNPRDRDIIRRYYFIGWTDQAIAQALNYDRVRITQLRNEIISRLD